MAVAQEEGVATPYALFNISERVQMFIEPGTKVYDRWVIELRIHQMYPAKADLSSRNNLAICLTVEA